MHSQIEKIIPLTPAQEGILYESVSSETDNLYTTQISISLRGSLCASAMERAVEHLVKRNGALRSVFKWEKIKQPVQIILHTAPNPMKILDLKSAADAGLATKTYLQNDRDEPFDLRQSAFRVGLIQIAHDAAVLVISSHHVLLDGWSNGVLLEELFAFYRHFAHNMTLTLTEKTQLSAFRDAQVEALQNSSALHYWTQHLEGFSGNPELPKPVDVARAGSETLTSARYSVKLDRTALDGFAKEHNVTVSSVLYAAWGLILRSYYNSDDVSFGTAASNRPSTLPQSSSVLSLAIQTIPVRLRIDKQASLIDYVRQVQQLLTESMSHLNFSLADAFAQADVSPQMNLLSSLFVVENYPINFERIIENSQLSVESYDHWECNEYPLTACAKLFDDYALDFQYAENQFTPAFIHRLSEQFSHLLTAIFSTPRKEALTTGLLSKNELDKLHRKCNPTLHTRDTPAFAIDAFEQTVERHPDAIALRQRQQTLSYRELDNMANHVAAHALPGEGIVAVMLEPSIDMIAAMLACMKRGVTYLPIDIDNPDQRVIELVRDSQCSTLITTNERIASLKPEINVALVDMASIDLDGRAKTPRPVRRLSGDDLLYIIYTSGSTGTPKGVTISQSAFGHFIQMYERLIPLRVTQRVVSLTGIAFDIFFGETLTPLVAGCEVVLGGQDLSKDGQKSLSLVSSKETVLFQTTPSRLKMLLLFARKQTAKNRLHNLVVAGEAFPKDLYQQARAYFGPDCRIFNLYGPTEGTIYATGLEIADDTDITIGHSLSNTESSIIDRFGNVQPPEIPGELFLSGPSLSSGYLNKPELTQRAFTTFRQHHDKRMYATRDIARYRCNGEVDLLGRSDDQIKIRGYRVEIGEVTARIKALHGIQDALVISDTDQQGFNRLLAFVIPHPNADVAITYDQIKDQLSAALPSYMVPSRLQVASAFPVSSNGKTDRAALVRQLRHESPQVASSSAAVANDAATMSDTESLLADIWADVLTVPRVDMDRHSNFMELGGQSLKASRVVSRIHKQFDVKLKHIDIFRNPKIGQLAKQLEERRAAQTGASQPRQTIANSEPALGESSHSTLATAPTALTPQQTSMYLMQQVRNDTRYNIATAFEIRGSLDHHTLNQAFCELIRRHEALRTSFELENGIPRQRVHDAERLLDSKSNQLLTRRKIDRSQLDLAISAFCQPHKLDAAPILRAQLLSISTVEHVLLLDIHHIVADGASVNVLLEELLALYSGASLPAASLEFSDYRQWSETPKPSDAEQYWLDHHEHGISETKLPGTASLLPDHPDYFAASRFQTRLSRSATAALESWSQANAAPLTSLLFSLTSLFVAKLSGQAEVVVTTPCENRLASDIPGAPQNGLEKMVGMTVNTLAIKSCYFNEQSVADAIAASTTHFLESLEHQSYPFESLVEKLNIDRREGDRLFPVMYLHEEHYQPTFELGDLTFSQVEIPPRDAKFDLLISTRPVDGEIEFVADYRTMQFPDIALLMSEFLRLIEWALANPAAQIGALDLSRGESDVRTSAAVPQGDDQIASSPVPRRMLGEVRDIWSTILGVDHGEIETGDNFFELGGNSLQANQLVAELRDRYHCELTLNHVFRHPTLGAIARLASSTSTAPGHDKAQDPLPELASANRGGYSPLTAAQKRIFLAQQVGTDTSYNIPAAFRLTGSVDIDHLEQILNYIVHRHESLRTSFHDVDHVPHQKVALTRRLSIQAGVATRDTIDSAIRGFIKPFDLSRSPLMRVGLLTIEPEEHILVFDVHHIAVDGTSLSVILEDFAQLYQGWIPTPKSLDFLDFLPAYSKLPEAEHERFWLEQHQDSPQTPPSVVARTSSPRPGIGGRQYLRLESETSESLIQMARELGTTPFTVLFSAISIALARTSGRSNNVIGTAVENRDVPLSVNDARQLQHTVGMFVNTLAIPVRVDSKQSLVNTVRQINQQLHECYQHQQYPFDRLIQAITATSKKRTSALFSVMYVHEPRFTPSIRIGGLELQPVDIAPLNNNFELLISSRLNDDQLEFSIDYSDAIAPDVGDLIAYMHETFRHVAHRCATTVGALPAFAAPTPDKTAPLPVANTVAEVGPQEVPQDMMEKIKSVWSKLLFVDPGALSESSNFFELGGHSLKAYQMVSQLQKHFGVKIPISAVFNQADMASVGRIIATNIMTDVGAASPLPQAPARQYYPLTPAQQRIFFLHQEEPNTRYNMPAAFRIEGPVSSAILETALKTLIDRHVALRMSFSAVNAKPAQEVHACNDLTFRLDQQWIAEHQIEQQLREFVRPFDLRKAPLLRAKLLTISDDDNLLLIDLHHIVFDGMSFAVLYAEFDAILSGRPLPSIDHDFVDYADWLQDKDYGKSEQFWIDHHAGDAPQPMFESALDSAWQTTQQVVRTEVQLPENLARSLSALNQRQSVSSFNVFFTLVSLTLHHYLGRDDVVLSTPVANRHDEALTTRGSDDRSSPLESMIGMFVNTLAIKSTVDPTLSFSQHLTKTSQTLSACLAHQGYPLERLIETLHIDTSTQTSHPLLSVMFVHDEQSPTHYSLGNLTLRPLEISPQDAKFDLMIQSRTTGDGVSIVLDHRQGLNFEPAVFGTLLKKVIELSLCDDTTPVAAWQLDSPSASSEAGDKPDSGLPVSPSNTRQHEGSDRTTQILRDIWVELLETDECELDASSHFFALGGHSLKANLMALEIADRLNVEVPITQIFYAPTLGSLARFVDASAPLAHYECIPSTPRADTYPISEAQRSLYSFCKADARLNTAYNVPNFLRLKGPLDVPRLEHAFDLVLRRHESLRSAFLERDGEVRQRIYVAERRKIKVTDSEPNFDAIQTEIRRFVQAFDLQNGPLTRIHLLRFSPDDHLLMFDVHHIVFDGVSSSILFDELVDAYDGQALADAGIQFRDYAAWESDYLQSAQCRASQDYWLGQFSDPAPTLELPTDRNRPEHKTYAGASHSFFLSPSLTTKITQLNRATGTTPFMFLLTVINVILMKRTQADDFVVGTVVTGRSHADLARVIGFFINALALRNRPSKDQTFLEFLSDVREKTLDAYTHQHYPFSKLVNELRLPRDTSRSPLFDVMLVMQNFDGATRQFSELEAKPHEFEFINSKYDLLFSAGDTDGQLRIVIEYSTDLFDRATINKLATDFTQLVEQVLSDPRQKLADIGELSAVEKQLVLDNIERSKKLLDTSFEF